MSRKIKRFTRKQLYRARLRAKRELRDGLKADKAQQRRLDREDRRVSGALRGCRDA